MKLWTLCDDVKQWKSSFTMRKWDSMGNVVDEIDKIKDSPLTLKEYPDDFLDKISEVFENYAFQIDEYESYENDDNDTSGEYERQYTSDLSPKDKIVICNGEPVGFMIESKAYKGGMDNRTMISGTILYFKDAGNPDNSYTIYDQSGRWRSRRTYTIVKRK